MIRRCARWWLGTPGGRRALLALALAAAWAWWAYAPPRPVAEWTVASAVPVEWQLARDRTCLACRTLRDVPIAPGTSAPEYGPLRLWDLASGRQLLAVGAEEPA